ncbi:coenzyme F420-0:L-glutamate ligase [Sphingobium lactosutens]|uniref:coenzyme F420-0:L-glutamate ligase n=1 Tax=Sphingobium lactosutens TaxID=522773 RepID=UPI0015BBE1C7|nr:coenzyme F420-0:L-glutamate ligase [Sphingobium lactosutens]NWK94444.1 coenzyme F420-0:L-glutamate ligase [Sphingobium lactosutens]
MALTSDNTRNEAGLVVTALTRFPLVHSDDDLASLIVTSLESSGGALLEGDVVVLAQKIVSKAEGRLVVLDSVSPSAEATALANRVAKDPRLVELVLQESSEVLRAKKGVLIVRHRLGFVLANAGIDKSNIDHRGQAAALLLPRDPDASARRLRDALMVLSGVRVAVVIIDSLGRAWRQGTTGTAIGVAGMPGLLDLRGREDLYGRRLETSELGFADEVAAAASLLMGQSGEGRPVVIVRGLAYDKHDGAASDLIRPLDMDLFQ